METIEQLKQDNAKLQERLNNAAKFFREQKAQIESLTNEVKEKTELALDYRNQIESKDKAYKTLQETYNEVFAENEELKRKPKDDFVSSEKWNALVTEKESLNKQLNEYELKLQDSETAYEQLYKKYDVRKNQIAELTGNIEVQKNEYELKLQNSKNTCEEIQKKYNKVSIENKQLKEQIASMVTETTNIAEEYAKVTLSLENYKNENTTLKNDIKILNDDVIKQNQEIELYNELKEKYDKLSQLYDHIENEKMAYATDLDVLQQKYNDKVAQEKANLEIGTNLINTLQNIWQICDDKLNPKPKEEKKINKQIDTINKVKDSTGNQFMSDAKGMNI